MIVHFDENSEPPLSMDIRHIPYYARGAPLLRMWIAFAFSLIFTMVVGYVAAKNRICCGPIILPALDVLQSVPVLGFLSVTVTGFMALFPGSLIGVECASIFAIFTGQVWNMTFGFYHSLITIPTDMQEAASTYRLNRWQRFATVEAPASVHSLIWNSMMSFGGGWFFVAQSEAISVMNKNIKLPGLGSYMAVAQERGDTRASMLAIVAMVIVVVASDQLVWRPVLVWADRFKIELTESGNPPTSWLYNLLRGTYVFEWLFADYYATGVRLDPQHHDAHRASPQGGWENSGQSETDCLADCRNRRVPVDRLLCGHRRFGGCGKCSWECVIGGTPAYPLARFPYVDARGIHDNCWPRSSGRRLESGSVPSQRSRESRSQLPRLQLHSR